MHKETRVSLIILVELDPKGLQWFNEVMQELVSIYSSLEFDAR